MIYHLCDISKVNSSSQQRKGGGAEEMAEAVGVEDICFVSLLIKLRTVHEILSEEKMEVCLNQG